MGESWGKPDTPRRHRKSTSIAAAAGLSAAIFALAEHRIVVDELRVEQASLDDAFLALTGTALED